jgi:uncharacterized protein RhaS with RHS repeats
MGGSTYYLAYDQVGTLRLVTDSSGNVVKQIDYDTFGNILSVDLYKEASLQCLKSPKLETIEISRTI